MFFLRPSRRSGGFTLIELLIVVAIIAILAAIAVPNFLEAQVRSKISRAKADMRSLVTGLESYNVDNNNYPDVQRTHPLLLAAPAPLTGIKLGTFYSRAALPLLTTPISYLTTSLFRDPFTRSNDPNDFSRTYYFGYANARAAKASDATAPDVNDLGAVGISGVSSTDTSYARWIGHRFVLQSVGPDTDNYVLMNAADQNFPRAYFYLTLKNTGWNFLYDPTNGTTSVGDIVRTVDGPLN